METGFRPRYHFAPPSGWMNDPNGLVCHNGEFHLFYQWCAGLVCDGGAMGWGHAVSPDLIDWTHLPVALEPDALGAIWSGSAVEDRDNTSGLLPGRGGLVAVFTHHAPGGAERQSLAFSGDGGRTWTKFSDNPVLGDDSCRDFRDPKVFWHEPVRRWVMIVGVRQRLYASADLRHWTFLSETGFSSECPDLFPLPIEGEAGTRWLLSLAGREYVVGSFDGAAFTAEGPVRRVDGGMDFYAAQSWENCLGGRRVWIGWLNNWKYARQVPDFGARGFMTIPRELTLRRGPDGALNLIQRPAAELAGLRRAHVRMDCSDLTPGRLPIAGECLEIVVTMAPAPGDRCGLKVRASDGEETVIGYDANARVAFLDRARSGSFQMPENAPVPLPARGDKVSWRVFVDRSSVEAFFNDGDAVITAQVYPAAGNSGLAWFTESGRSRIESLDVYDLGRRPRG